MLYSPDGTCFVFLHRWIQDGIPHTRLYVLNTTAEADCLLENRYISHFCWLEPSGSSCGVALSATAGDTIS